MATYSRQLLSASTNGKPIAVAATATLLHTAIAGTASFDEVYLWASNVTATAATLTIEWGGTTDAELACKAPSIPANSPPIPIVTGVCIQNSLLVRALSGTASAINITGFVNRIS